MSSARGRAGRWLLMVLALAGAWTAGRLSASHPPDREGHDADPAPGASARDARRHRSTTSGDVEAATTPAPPPASGSASEAPKRGTLSVRERLVAAAGLESEYGEIVVRTLAREGRESPAVREQIVRLLHEESDPQVLDWLGRILIFPALADVTPSERDGFLRLLRQGEPRERRIAAGRAWMRVALDEQPPQLARDLTDLVDGGVPVDSLEPVLTVASELRLTRQADFREALERAAARGAGPGMRPVFEALLRGMPGERAFDWVYERWTRAASDSERATLALALADFLPRGLGARRSSGNSSGTDHVRLDRYVEMFRGTGSAAARERLAARVPVVFGLTGADWAMAIRRLAAAETDSALRERIATVAQEVEAGRVRDTGVATRLLGTGR